VADSPGRVLKTEAKERQIESGRLEKFGAEEGNSLKNRREGENQVEGCESERDLESPRGGI